MTDFGRSTAWVVVAFVLVIPGRWSAAAEFELLTGVDAERKPGVDRLVFPVPGPGFPNTFDDGDRLAGLLILNLRGAFVGYIQTVCAAPEYRGKGVGTALVAFAEERILREHRNVFICVSDFNPAARRLYERLGYQRVGELTDYLVAGHSELLLRKTRGPLTP